MDIQKYHHTPNQSERHWLRLALAQAKKGRGTCQPNPMVGAVIVRADELLGKGHHIKAGTPHAEINAINDAGADKLAGSTLYVTLEPCSTYGRTPPCTEAIIRGKFARVVVACPDQNPLYQGRGLELLAEAGIQVALCPPEEPLRQDCEQLNESFFWWIQKKRPFVILKMAMTLDGKIAMPDGSSRWITGAASRRKVQELRCGAGAIMVGGRTALLDDPGLRVEGSLRKEPQPRVCVWTSRPLPDSLKLAKYGDTLRAKPMTRSEWLAFLSQLGRDNINNLLLEGGGELAAAALGAGIVNKVAFFIAPKFMLGRESCPVTGGASVPELAQAITLGRPRLTRFGDDVLYEAYLQTVAEEEDEKEKES